MTTARGVSLQSDSRVRFTRQGVRHALSKVSVQLVFAVLPVTLLVVVIGGSVHDHFAFDFHQFWQGGRDIVEGRSPYPPASAIPPGGADGLDPSGIQEVFKFPYPAPAALAIVPFGVLPFGVAAALFVVLSTIAVVVALRLFGVSDWRCHGLVFGSIVTLGALRLGTFTPLLLLGLAVAWRNRDRALVVAPVVAALVIAKLFLWPLLVWLLISRRTRTAGLAVATAVMVTVGSWLAIGFAGFAEYPDLLSSLASTVQDEGWSTVALGLSVGLPPFVAKAVAFAIGAGVLGIAGLAPRGERDRWSFALAIVAALVLSPIVWLHYFLLLVAPLAIAFPVLAPPWFLLLAFWLWPFQETGGDAWKIALGLTAMACVAAATLLRGRKTSAGDVKVAA